MTYGFNIILHIHRAGSYGYKRAAGKHPLPFHGLYTINAQPAVFIFSCAAII